MWRTALLIFGLVSGGLDCPKAIGQTPAPAQVGQEVASRLVSLAVEYPEDDDVRVQLRGTKRLPEATGEAKVKRKLGTTEIEAELDGMRPAISFGGDFNTYVLWTISSEGIIFNVGEFVLQGARSKLKVTTLLTTFGMFVTAEPHFLVQRPSGFFVLENTGEGLDKKKGLTVTGLEYDAIRTDYSYKQASLAAVPETKGRLRTDRYQAIIAVRLADEAAAQQYAPKEFAQAQASLSDTQQGFAQGMDEKRLMLPAHRTIRLAVESRRLALERAAQAALEAERQACKESTEQLTRAREDAERVAFLAREEAKQAREAAEKARAEAEQAERQMLRTSQEAERLARLKLEAEKQAESAQRQAAAIYARLEGALNRVAETRETARGLIVNLPDILFDSGKSTLRPAARDVLSRIAGVLLVASEYRLSIEGHTDSVGRSESNQRLSEERAQSVHDYLVEAQVSPALMTTRGFGESQPVASNRTASGRQQNRRVEIVIEGLTR